MSQTQWVQSVRLRWVILGGIAFVGVAGCLAMYHSLVLWEQGRRETDFRLQVQQRFHTIEEHIRNTFEAVEEVGAFFQASQYVSPEEFKTFTRPLLAKHPGLHELGWAGPDRGTLEGTGVRSSPGVKPGSPSGSAPGGVKEPVASAADSPAGALKSPGSPIGQKALKIYYLEALKPAFLKVGMDLDSLSGSDAILQQLGFGKSERAIGQIAVGGKRDEWVYFICVSASRSSGSAAGRSVDLPSGEDDALAGQAPGAGGTGLAPSATSEGVVFGVSQARVLMEQALKELPPLGIDLYWYHGSAEENGRLICYWPGDVGSESTRPLSGAELIAGLHEHSPMEIFGQPWRLYGAPTPTFLAKHSSLAPELIFMGGLSVLCVLLAYVHLVLSRHAQVQTLVQRRTAELRKAKENLELQERTLQESQALYSSLVEGLPVAVLRKNVQGRFTFANQAFCRLLKRPLEEILGKTDFDLYPSDLAEKYRADDRRVMETGQFLETVEENVQEGERKYVQVMKFPIRDAAGQIVGVQVIFWDITDRRRAEMALEKERTLLQTLMDNLPHNIYFKDHQSRFIRINRAMARYFGLSHPSEAEGKTDFDFFTPEHAEQAMADEQYILATGRSILNKEEKETWPDGHISWVSTTKLPLRDAEGRIIGTYGISRDITEQKLAAEALKAAKEAAEAANQAKSQFLANVSHEIRTPLHALLGLTELVLEGPLESAQQAYVEMIRDAGENLLMVLNDLLDFSKIEAGRLELEQIPFRLRELTAETLKNLAFLAHGKGLLLLWYISPDTPETLVGDPLRLRQVISNLVGNAIKFTDRGEICLEVECLDQQADSVQLHFQVRDTGVGIPPEKLENIFEMFEQADKSTTRKYGGTGLGLAICSRLAASMQGRIWAESQLGQGSCFHFTARFGLASKEEPWPAPDQLAPLQGRRILVLEPHPLERQNLEGLLRSWGLEPSCASNLAEAKHHWEAAAREGGGFDLLLMTAAWPAQEKSQIADWLSQSVQTRCRVIGMTPAGCVGSEVFPGARWQGATLIKPYTPSELLELVLWGVGVGPLPLQRPKREEPSGVPALPPLRILVAEDSPVGQQLAVGLLERYGHKVTLARTGREAVDAVQTQSFDVVLMDLHMPEMDGWEATQAIRSWEKQQGGHLPIIALTAHELSEELVKVRAYGMDHYISKPLRVRRLFQAISDVLQKNQAPTEHTAQSLSEPPAENPSELSAAALVGLVDWEAAKRAVRGDEYLLRSVVETLLQEAPQLQEAIRQAIAQQDARALRLAAHRLKGSVRIFGDTSIYQQAWAIEQLAQAGSFPSTESVQQLDEALRKLTEELRKQLRNSSAEGSLDA